MTQTAEPSKPGAPRPADWLAYLYAPLHPLTQRLRLPRAGRRRPDPGHILLPQGFAAELVASGSTPPRTAASTSRGPAM